MSRHLAAGLLSSLLLLLEMGCCPTPVVPVASGSKGVYLRAIPAKGGLSAEARAGLVERPERWPPAVLHDDCISGVREDEELAKALGIALEPMSCPWADMAPVPGLGGVVPPASGAVPPASGAVPPAGGAAPGADDDESGPSLGFGIHCYPFGEAVLVLETTERTGDCTHVVGLAIFRKDAK